MKRMKYIVLGFLVALATISLQAQIGINTELPQTLLHIDAKSNNSIVGAPTAAEVLDDVVVTSEGNIGVGTITPKRKLHIVTGGKVATPKVGLRIEDGNQGLNKVLLSDANGVAKWQPAPTPSALLAYRNPTAPNIPTNVSTFYNTGSYIDLPPGKWFVTVNTLVYAGVSASSSIHDRLFSHASFTETSAMSTTLTTANISVDVKDKKQIAKMLVKRSYNVLIGSFIIINSTENTKRYYYMFGAVVQLGTSLGTGNFSKVAGTANAENTMVGIQIQ